MRARARRRARNDGRLVEEILADVAARVVVRYDIFLSQTIRDAEIVLGVFDALTEMGYTVFCDWISEPTVDRDAVTPANAAFIREAMAKSASLLFIDTKGAEQSLWMCWEIGWFDGQNGHVGVLPVLADDQKHYRGREFLGLYPYVDVDENGHLRVVRPSATNRFGITIIEAPNSRTFDSWKRESEGFMRPRVIEHWKA
jgi:hypothetical protein